MTSDALRRDLEPGSSVSSFGVGKLKVEERQGVYTIQSMAYHIGTSIFNWLLSIQGLALLRSSCFQPGTASPCGPSRDLRAPFDGQFNEV